MLGELTSKIKLRAVPDSLSITEALRQPRLVRKQFEAPLVMQGREPLLVGRDESLANLVINDPYISRSHAAILHEKGGFYVQDLNSKNGTFLNGKRLEAGKCSLRPLEHGDRIRFNVIEFVFVVPKPDL